jgi:hypothetical protein
MAINDGLILDYLREEDFNVLYEVSPYRSEILKMIDQDFADLKKDMKDHKIIKSIVAHIKEFTGVNNVVFSIKSNYDNGFVVPVYNRQISLDMFELFKDFAADKNIRQLETIEETSKYIKKIYIVFGSILVRDFTARELTAILLHELGHCFTYTANMPGKLINLLRKIFTVIGLMPKVILIPLISLSLIHVFLISVVSLIICRSLTFLEHRAEYKADQFAAKYGYGDEIIKVLYKVQKIREDAWSKVSWFKKALNFIIQFFIPKTHPVENKRIIETSEKMLLDYKKLYPKVSKELTIIFNDIKGEA